jgi:quercetin dioxygenase-like cupin family protein
MGSGGHEPIVLMPGEGRSYDCGTMRAVFKADGAETGDRYSVSEWWLEPRSTGPGAHSHEANDELFLVLEGRPSVRVGETWHDLPPGGFLLIPAGTVHDFENRTDAPAGLFNVFIPGGFEPMMPAIVAWFRENR